MRRLRNNTRTIDQYASNSESRQDLTKKREIIKPQLVDKKQGDGVKAEPRMQGKKSKRNLLWFYQVKNGIPILFLVKVKLKSKQKSEIFNLYKPDPDQSFFSIARLYPRSLLTVRVRVSFSLNRQPTTADSLHPITLICTLVGIILSIVQDSLAYLVNKYK